VAVTLSALAEIELAKEQIQAQKERT